MPTIAEIGIIVALLTLTVTLLSHIFIIARWSGRVDAHLEEILKQPAAWAIDLTALGVSIRGELASQSAAVQTKLDIWTKEVERLRDARHLADGKIQMHEGKLQSYDRVMARLDTFIDEGGRGPLDRRKP